MKGRISRRQFWTAWGTALGVALLPALLATLPPFLGPDGRALIMRAFAPLCHQIPARSPHLMGTQLAVGHRVYGILLGLALGSLTFPLHIQWDDLFHRRAPRILAATALPMALDWTLGWLGLWANTPLSRMATGGLFGMVAGYILTRAIVQAEASAFGTQTATPQSAN